MFKNTYKKKVKALLEGLECERIEEFIIKAKVGDYRTLGTIYYKAIKDKTNRARKTPTKH